MRTSSPPRLSVLGIFQRSLHFRHYPWHDIASCEQLPGKSIFFFFYIRHIIILCLSFLPSNATFCILNYFGHFPFTLARINIDIVIYCKWHLLEQLFPPRTIFPTSHNLRIFGNYYIMLFPIKINVFSFPICSGIK